ncbi:MAG: hypothetical protein PHH27_01850, partial [Candidatus Colwellbacteria bacterium]|nr:hypothetical protein [Candidatus Colwellbacteria bacterium]
GIFSDAIIFGTMSHGWESDSKEIIDVHKNKHKIVTKYGFPGNMLGYQGHLSDLAYKTALEPFWGLLDWEYHADPEYKFNFIESREKVLFDIDLDAFIMQWSDFIFPWPDEVFEKWFHEKSTYDPTYGWSGFSFIEHLISQSGLITVAREPGCCGGEEKAEEILSKLNKHMFKNDLIT